MPNTKQITLEVCIPVTVELNVSVDDDGEVTIHGGQVVGESHAGDRWVTEHLDDATFQEIDDRAAKAFATVDRR